MLNLRRAGLLAATFLNSDRPAVASFIGQYQLRVMWQDLLDRRQSGGISPDWLGKFIPEYNRLAQRSGFPVLFNGTIEDTPDGGWRITRPARA